MDLAQRLNTALGGRYTVDRQIGEGGMGTVFLATDLRHDRRVAIKVFRSEVTEAVGAERFLQEIRIAAQLDHPHILMLIDSGAVDGLLHYVMPFVDGETLRDRMTREQRLPLADALRIAAQVADALDYAHKRGVVHRDIKPENILLADGHAKLADFGIARTMSAVGARLTQTGLAIGTPAYMSPEQFLGEEKIDGRSDQYSLACVLFEMLAGVPLFHAGSVQAIMAKRLTQDATRVATLRPNIPPMIDLVLARALAREPHERHASAGEFAAALIGEISGSSAIAMSSRDGTAVPARRAPLVGRDREIDEARTMLARLTEGRGGVLLVGGEPGVGKTRLCQSILDEARSRGALCLVGRCYEMEGTPPYTPYAELLDVVARLVPARTFRDVLGDAAPEIARVQPSLRQTFPDIPAPLDLPADRQRQHLYVKYREFNERAARVAPIVVLLDDLHWADEASLGLFEHAAGYLDTLPIIVLGTYRDVDLDVNRGFARVLESLTRQRLARRIALKRLTVDRVAEFLDALGGAPPPPALVKVIHAETDGNPFFVEEVFAHLKEEGRLFDAHGNWRTDLRVEDLDVPEGVRLVIGRRLERLTATCRAVLTSAAVIGPRFGLAVLEQLGDANEDELLDALDAGVQAHLISEQRGGREVMYTFTHELIRQTLLGALSLPRRQRRHVKVAAAIEKVLGERVETRPSDLAYHLYQAGAAADPDKTVHFLILSAEMACTSAAYEEAMAHCERARSIEEVTDKKALARLAHAEASALRGVGRWADALDAHLKTLDLAIIAGDAELVASSGLDASWLLGWQSRFAEALAVAERAYAHLPATPTASRARLMAQVAADWAMLHFDYAGGRERQAEALAIAFASGEPMAVTYALQLDTAIGNFFCRFDDSITAFDQVRVPLSNPAHRQAYLESAGFWHAAKAYGGRWAEALTDRPELERLAREAGNIGMQLQLGLARSIVDCSQAGDWEATERFNEQTKVSWAAAGPWAQLMQANVAMAQLVRGEVERALETAHRARSLFPHNIWTGYIESIEIVCAAYRGDAVWNDRLVEFARLVPQLDPVPTTGSGFYGFGLAVGHHIRGEYEPLAALYPALRTILNGGTRCNFIWMTEAIVALAAAASNNWVDAEQHFESALVLAQKIQHQFAKPQVQHWYAEMLIRRGAKGDRARVDMLLRDAINAYRSMGMTLMLERAERLLV